MKERLNWFNKYFQKGTGKFDPQFVAYRDEAHDLAFKRAFELLSITEADVKEESAIVLMTPEQLDVKSKVRFKVALFDDDEAELLYDQALITILMFGEESLFYYQANADYRYGLVTNDLVGELNYLDIMNIETTFEYDDLHNPLFEIVNVELWLYDGTILPLTLRYRLFNGVIEELVLSPKEKLVLNRLHSIVRNKRSFK
ncbi:MAG: hypothetical protein ACOX56_04760 [Acholeplasmataceae bacterium]|jgi:hypothetical protein